MIVIVRRFSLAIVEGESQCAVNKVSKETIIRSDLSHQALLHLTLCSVKDFGDTFSLFQWESHIHTH